MSKASPQRIEANVSPSRSHLRGYLLAAAAAVLWGFSGVVTKYLLRRQMRPDELLVFRTSISAAILVVWLGLRSPQMLKVRRGDLLPLILLGAIGLALNQYFYYLSLTMVSVGYSLLLQYLAPVHLMAYGALSKTERMTGGKLLAAFTAICGCGLMVLGQEGGIARLSLAGTLSAIASGVCFAFYTAYGKQLMKSYDPRTVITYVFLTSGAIWLTARPPWKIDWASIDLSMWIFFIYLASAATLLPFALYSASLRYLEASRSSLTSMLEPVVAASVAWMWLGEEMELLQIAGGAAVLGGVLLLQIESLMRVSERQRDRETEG
ncbi:MAG TPA: EamA family transporter [Blastocatellia bacterium]|nr:EamA family transporter [Blastocatellia bacterium]